MSPYGLVHHPLREHNASGTAIQAARGPSALCVDSKQPAAADRAFAVQPVSGRQQVGYQFLHSRAATHRALHGRFPIRRLQGLAHARGFREDRAHCGDFAEPLMSASQID
jgi:hypothetical protein